MPSKALCSIAVFHDGSHVANAQKHYCSEAGGTRWLDLGSLHELIEAKVKENETTYERHCVTYAAWFQGISGIEVGREVLRRDRRLLRDLMKEGIHPTFLPMSSGNGAAREKGVDVALAISAMEVAFTNRVDLVALVTGDADFVPLVWALKRRGLRVAVFGFDFVAKGADGELDGRSTKLAKALVDAANFGVHLSSLERSVFEGLLSLRTPTRSGRTERE